MIVDANLIVSGTVSGATVTGQTFTGTGLILSANCIDLSCKRDMGEGEDIYLRGFITTAFTGATSVEFQAIAADDAALTSNVTVIGSSGAIPVASLIQGYRFTAEINPRLGSTGQRYMGARANIVGTATAGAAMMDFGIDLSDGGKTYPVGFSII